MLKEIQFVQRVLIEQCSHINAWLPGHNPAVHYVVALYL